MADVLILADGVRCDAALSRKMRQKLSTLLQRNGENQNAIDSLLLALTEHLANLYKHTQAQCCSVFWHNEARELEIIDQGPSIEKMLATADDLSELSMQESGMGLSLIASVIANYRYQSLPTSNHLVLPLPQQKARILLIDDDLVFLTLVEAYLEDDYEVICFSDAKAALAYKELAQIDLVICDLHMPQISGYQLREQFLQQETTALLPFIFLTGDNSEQQRDKASESQVDDYLLKPVDKSLLIASVKRVLLRSQRLRSQINNQLDNAISQTLWPKGPWRSGEVNISYAFQVAERGGGDFLFHQSLTEGSHRFVLGDLMGHGEQAKFYAFALTGLLSGFCASFDNQQTTASFLHGVSQLIFHSELLNNTLVTLQVIDVFANGQVSICSAGHPSPWRLNSSNCSKVTVEGALPGLTDDASYSVTSLQLEPGEALLFYSDGLFEALLQQQDESALAHELNRFVEQRPLPASASELANFWRFEQQLLDDDVSILLLNRN